MSAFWLHTLRRDIYRSIKVAIPRLRTLGIEVLVLTLMIGCGGGTKRWQVMLMPTSTLNQDEGGASLPVMVRVYQLRGKDKFQQAPFKSLWKSDNEALEGDLIERREVIVQPDTHTVMDLDLNVRQGAMYVGVVALFRKPGVEGWKYLTPATSSALNPFTPKIKLILDGNSITPAD